MRMGLLWLLLVGCALQEPADSEPEDIPVVGRPTDLPFSGASGRFKTSATASARTVRVGQPLTLKLQVQATGPVRHPPRRIDLREIASFNERFYIEDPPASAPPPPDAKSWEFTWILKPRRRDVREIPGIPFVYFDPSLRTANPSLRFQTPYTDPIPLTVEPEATVVVQPRPVPDNLFELARGPEVLSRQERWQPPGALPLGVLLVAPPLLGLAVLVIWRRLYPDTARLAQRRRSRAARLALQDLERSRRRPPRDQAEEVARTVAGYLNQRLELPLGEPTPAEVEAWLRSQQLPAELCGQIHGLLCACDEARFGPNPSEGVGRGAWGVEREDRRADGERRAEEPRTSPTSLLPTPHDPEVPNPSQDLIQIAADIILAVEAAL
jgi:hypothetical protein